MKNGYGKRERLLFLISHIPCWEVHLTKKQLESTKLYLSKLDTTLVDYELGLNNGVSYLRIFGSANSKSRGALGRLEKAYSRLEKLGYLKKKETPKEKTKKFNKLISNKTIEKTKKLFLIFIRLENWESYLVPSQVEKATKFLELKSFKACAKYFNIKESSFKQALLGKTDNDGILGRLNKAYEKKYMNNWECL